MQQISDGSKKHSDVLLRLVDFSQNIGRSSSTLDHLSVALGIPSPHASTIRKASEFINRTVVQLAKESTDRAIESAMKASDGEGLNLSTDGQWHTRGHGAKHCTIELLDANSHKLVDVITMSKGKNGNYPDGKSSAEMEPTGFRLLLEVCVPNIYDKL